MKPSDGKWTGNMMRMKITNDSWAFANLIHELISGMKINILDNGKKLIHQKVKYSPYYDQVCDLLDKSRLTFEDYCQQ